MKGSSIMLNKIIAKLRGLFFKSDEVHTVYQIIWNNDINYCFTEYETSQLIEYLEEIDVLYSVYVITIVNGIVVNREFDFSCIRREM
jgi:hypothetical protein